MESVAIKQYIRKHPYIVSAYQYTTNNDEGLFELLKKIPGMYHYYRNKLIVIDIIHNERRVKPGEYIVILPNGLLTVMDKEEFSLIFDCIEEKKDELAYIQDS